MIFVYPHNADWNALADPTGDPSWRADRMRDYFERLENCHHRPRVPGLFIVSAVYMVGEKAADVIVAAAQQRRS